MHLLEIENKKGIFVYRFLPFAILFFQIWETLSLESKTTMQSKISSALRSLSTQSQALSYPYPYPPIDNEHTLYLSGTAMREIETNLIKIGINIETLNMILRDSYEENSQTSAKVTNIFEQMGIPRRNISTTNYEITPVYENEYFAANNSYVSVFKGYRVKNQIEVTLSKKRLAADLIDKVVLSGPVLISYVSFGFTDGFIKNVKDSLLEEATLDSYERARSIAGTLRVSIEDVKQITISDFLWPQASQLNYQFERAYISGAGPSMAPPTFYSGTQWVTMNVGVTFVIVKE
jgi:uncharacterized protein YggE